jgi:hypothetical protein
METRLPSKKNYIFPSFNYVGFAKLNVLGGWKPTSTKEESRTPLFSAALCFLENRHWAMENEVKVFMFMLKGKMTFLYIGQPHLQGQDQLSDKSLVQKPAKLSVKLSKQ